MRSFKFATFALLVVWVLPSSRADVYGIDVPEVGSLGVVDGKVSLTNVRESDRDWNLGLPNTFGTTTAISSNSKKWAGWSLGYDADGKSQAVTLDPADPTGRGKRWTLTRVGNKKYTIQAAEAGKGVRDRFRKINLHKWLHLLL